ncbi:FBP1-like protein [Mya arenaria]|uniref:FBP1-like protein n=1 Tax=Mya arenaria TaxID=6604 RepID=A0ABY7FZN5_MYAAR|nr:FBP1-like protein [Mya arenaria]
MGLSVSINFSPPITGQYFPYMRTMLHVNSNILSPNELTDIIKMYAGKYVFPDGIETYRIGDFYIVLKVVSISVSADGVFELYNSTRYVTDSTQYTLQSTTYPTIFTTLVFSTLLSSPGVVTSTVVYSKQNSTVTFLLQFAAPIGQHLKTAVPSVIIHKAPKSRIRNNIVLEIGDLHLLYDALQFEVSVTNYTSVVRTPSMTSMSVSMTSSTIPGNPYSASLVNVVCEVVMSIPGELLDKSSSVFVAQQSAFCQQLKGFFDDTTSSINFHLVFGTEATHDLASKVIDAIDFSAEYIDYGGDMQFNVGFQDCLRQPCRHGGTCVETFSGYRCQCTSAWAGTDCEISTKVAPCASSPCARGTCNDVMETFTCVCPKGWTGVICDEEQVSDPCSPSPCKHGDHDECSDKPEVCLFGGTCTNQNGGFRCACSPGRTGVNECKSSPCRAGSQCLDSETSYVCVCEDGWTGKHCMEDVDECTSQICQNGGTCLNTVGSFTCACADGWSGPVCSICKTWFFVFVFDLMFHKNECSENAEYPCQNDGVCTNTLPGYFCTCMSGWTGDHCETDINECEESPGICSNGGTCLNEVGSYRCQCPAGRAGLHCDGNIDECQENVCLNGATCENLPGSYQCSCNEYWTGSVCDIDVNECGQFLGGCYNGGTCTNSIGGFSCECSAGYTGERCDTVIDQCPSCQNGGTCVNSNGEYSCSCQGGWTGTLCETDIRECDTPSFCKNGGTCTDFPGGFDCDCIDGWIGKTCTMAKN